LVGSFSVVTRKENDQSHRGGSSLVYEQEEAISRVIMADLARFSRIESDTPVPECQHQAYSRYSAQIGWIELNLQSELA
jgi:hypothetical protein